MQADRFYDTHSDKALPLILLAKADAPWTSLCESDANTLKVQGFKGLPGDMAVIYDTRGFPSKIYIGASLIEQTLAIAMVVNRLPQGYCYLAPPSLDRLAGLAWSLAQYSFDQYKTTTTLPRILILQEPILSSVLVDARAIFLVRDLINRPANDLNPQGLANVVLTMSQEFGAEYKEWVGADLLNHNFPAIFAVGQAAACAPRLLCLTWGNESHPKVSLVGKGVCFDSGGLDLKPSSGMRLMKKDMGGAAQVLGLAQWIMSHQLPIRLQVFIPAVENAVGSKAYRPGDIISMRNGLNVEIDNTDAEGRLVLADAMVKACEDNPELLIDFATLTGAARIAVGTEISAMFANDDQVAESITIAASKVNDPVWRMPLYAGYAAMIESNVADLANSSASSYAGAITAALFLQHFVTSSISWVHFDVMAWNVANKPGRPEGGEAMGMMAVGQYLLERYT